jgi:endonuclease/exonuclease/phosphatase family metal-dependent hydrolase
VEWEIALLQEAPPRWLDFLAKALGAEPAMTLTSRNSLPWLRTRLAEWNPDLIASNEGGSNQLLVRPPWRIEERREHTIARRPERRRMLWTLLRGPSGAQIAVANLHGSETKVPGHGAQVLEAAERAVEWAGEVPLLFGGDLNLRRRDDPEVFDELDRRLGPARPTVPSTVDHLLVRGLDVMEAPGAATPEARELPAGDGRAMRLSDHAYVAATLSMR